MRFEPHLSRAHSMALGKGEGGGNRGAGGVVGDPHGGKGRCFVGTLTDGA